MKCLIILFFATCLTNSYCSAQDLELKTNVPKKKPQMKKFVQTYAVTFTTNDTCTLKIDGEDRGEIVKSETIKLPLGTYRLFFESLETGEAIKKRVFRLTKDSLTDGKYTLAVMFRGRK
jgi:hypothetical protein